MDQIPQNSPASVQPAAQPGTTVATPASTQSSPQAAQPSSQSAAQPTTPPTPSCKCPTVNESDWDKKKKVLNKTFYKTFSPRLLYIPFSFAIDVDRAKKLALRKGYQMPDNPMILSEDGMFWGSILIEVTGTQSGDSGIVNLNQEVYTKVSKRDWKDMKIDMTELNQELGQAPKEVYSWYTSCPKCKASKVVKTVLIAVPQAKAVSQSATPLPPDQPSVTTPPATPAASATPVQPIQPPSTPSG